MSRKQLVRFALVAGIAFSFPACANTTTQTASSNTTARTAHVIVRNSNLHDVNLYIVNGSTRVRIGSARGMATSRLTIPAVYLTPMAGVTIQADPIGTAGAYTFPAIHVNASQDVLRLDVANVLVHSMAWTQQRH